MNDNNDVLMCPSSARLQLREIKWRGAQQKLESIFKTVVGEWCDGMQSQSCEELSGSSREGELDRPIV